MEGLSDLFGDGEVSPFTVEAVEFDSCFIWHRGVGWRLRCHIVDAVEEAGFLGEEGVGGQRHQVGSEGEIERHGHDVMHPDHLVGRCDGAIRLVGSAQERMMFWEEVRLVPVFLEDGLEVTQDALNAPHDGRVGVVDESDGHFATGRFWGENLTASLDGLGC